MSTSFRAGISPQDSWDTIASHIAAFLQLPDVLTGSGLTEAEACLPEIHQKLLYFLHQHRDFELAQVGVMIIWARLCSSQLWQAFLVDCGMLPEIKTFLIAPDTRLIALQSLAAINQAANGPTRLNIAKETMSTLISILRNEIQSSGNNSRVMELALSVVLRATYSALTYKEEGPVDPQECGIDLSEVISVAVDSMRTSRSTFRSNYLVIFLLQEVIGSHRNVVFANPSAIQLILASLRSNNLGMRAQALATLRLLSIPYSDVDRSYRSSQAFAALFDKRNIPPHIEAALDIDSEMIRACDAHNRFVSAMHKVVRDKDLYSLGSTLFELIMETEDSIFDGNFVDISPGDSPFLAKGEKHGLPFDEWSDALPCCAKVIRARGAPDDFDVADVLELKNFSLDHDVIKQHQLAAAALKRNPDNAFFYWAAASHADEAIGLRLAKRGLKCKKPGRFTRLRLLDVAIGHSFNLGLGAITIRATEAMAILTSCLEDCATYLSICPVDAFDIHHNLCIHIVLSLCLLGSELSDDLAEIKHLLDKLELVNDTFKYIYGSNAKSLASRMVQLITPQLASSIHDWGQTISRINSQGHPIQQTSAEMQIPAVEPGAESAIWLSNSDGPLIPTAVVDETRVPLFFCSYCRNPDANIQRCSRCANARYCDAYCQKKDWKRHRAACASSDIR